MEWLIIEQCYLLSILRVEYSDLYYIEMFSLAKKESRCQAAIFCCSQFLHLKYTAGDTRFVSVFVFIFLLNKWK